MNEHERAHGATSANSSDPPDGLPRYRLLTGLDDDAFCHRVSAAIALGYELYGSPAVTSTGATVVAAQAVLWPAS
jgi:hypothetical protein